MSKLKHHKWVESCFLLNGIELNLVSAIIGELNCELNLLCCSPLLWIVILIPFGSSSSMSWIESNLHEFWWIQVNHESWKRSMCTSLAKLAISRIKHWMCGTFNWSHCELWHKNAHIAWIVISHRLVPTSFVQSFTKNKHSDWVYYKVLLFLYAFWVEFLLVYDQPLSFFFSKIDMKVKVCVCNSREWIYHTHSGMITILVFLVGREL